MEEDYKLYDEKTEKLLDDLEINYVWRDSCIHLLVETKKCIKNDFTSTIPILNNLSICKGVQDLWKSCEKGREIKLLDEYFVKYKSYETLLKEKLDKEKIKKNI